MYVHISVCLFVRESVWVEALNCALAAECIILTHTCTYVRRLNPPTPVNNSNGRETKLHPVSRWDVIIEDLSSEEDDVASEEWALI